MTQNALGAVRTQWRYCGFIAARGFLASASCQCPVCERRIWQPRKA